MCYVLDKIQMLIKKLNGNSSLVGVMEKDLQANDLYEPKFVQSNFLMDVSCEGVEKMWRNLNLELLPTNKFILMNFDMKGLKNLIQSNKGLGSQSEVYLLGRDVMDEFLIEKG